jgi:hypothetical protein
MKFFFIKLFWGFFCFISSIICDGSAVEFFLNAILLFMLGISETEKNHPAAERIVTLILSCRLKLKTK